MEPLLSRQVQFLKGIGPKRAQSLAACGVHTVEDLLYYFPRRYEDRANCATISKLQEGQTQTVKAKVLARGLRRSFRRRAFTILEVAVGDDTGKLYCVWFNQPYLKDYFLPGTTVMLFGRVERYSGRVQMNAPEFEVIGAPDEEEDEPDESLHVGRIVPIYSLPEHISQRVMRSLIMRVLNEQGSRIEEYLPREVVERRALGGLQEALRSIHFPQDARAQASAVQRLSFDEFFFFQLPLALRKLTLHRTPGISHKVEGGLYKSFLAGLPFELTSGQRAVLDEISRDMAQPHPMQRLLQGDVGSGKTVVAAAACCIAVQGGYQAVFMAPTEILARQHFNKLQEQLQGAAFRGKPVALRMYAGSSSAAERRQALAEMKSGKADIVIGTHALLEEGVAFKDLGLVVIDEQHKFGVGQRALLPQKGVNPDVLIMTATPIPRTLAITLYGDLEISVIRHLPPGRLPVQTRHCTSRQMSAVYSGAKKHLAQRHQVYVVYPVIEESFALDIAGAKKMFEQLKAGPFKEYRIGLIHGRMKQEEQDAAMAEFKEGALDVLVTTTVLEVGIDVANATCIIIAHAERFGLSQLHQLRGRVGRGSAPSECYLVSDPVTPQAKARLEAMVRFTDGFLIAEEDLKIRGPGEFFGRRQHGLSELKIANPLSQLHLLKDAREEALRLLQEDPHLSDAGNARIKEKLLARFPEYESLVVVG
jgi:ATP-dependent DNA helicase RecG